MDPATGLDGEMAEVETDGSRGVGGSWRELEEGADLGGGVKAHWEASIIGYDSQLDLGYGSGLSLLFKKTCD